MLLSSPNELHLSGIMSPIIILILENNMKVLSVIIPVYNEEGTLKELVKKVIDTDISSVGYTKQIVLVNDGSKDRSEEIIYELITEFSKICEIKYIKNKQNSGK